VLQEQTDPDLKLRRPQNKPVHMLNTGSILVWQEHTAEPISPDRMDTETENRLDTDMETFLKKLHKRRRILFSPLPSGRPTAVLPAVQPSVTATSGSDKKQGMHVDSVAGTEKAASAGASPTREHDTLGSPVTLASLPAQRVCMELAKDSSYDDVVQALGQRIHQYVPLSCLYSRAC
jgi:hypothetical protein